MTRTILNWSELLEDYRGKSITKEPALKKWSDIGRPEPSEKLKHISIEPQNSFESPEPTDQLLRPNPNVKTKIKNVDFDNNNTENPLLQHQVSENKISLAKLLYDTRFQDTETIPSLYGFGQLPDKEENKLSERDILLLDLLEQNFQK